MNLRDREIQRKSNNTSKKTLTATVCLTKSIGTLPQTTPIKTCYTYVYVTNPKLLTRQMRMNERPHAHV